jgi:hypothetical protein
MNPERNTPSLEILDPASYADASGVEDRGFSEYPSLKV